MKTPSLRQKAGILSVMALGLLTVSASAGAVTAGDAAHNVFSQLASFADVAMAVMFLSGLVVGGLSAFKFKAHSDNPQQNKITTPIVYAIVAAFLIGLPAFLNMAKESTLGTGESNSMSQSAYDAVGN